jgi:hypothetical protein
MKAIFILALYATITGTAGAVIINPKDSTPPYCEVVIEDGQKVLRCVTFKQ